MCIHKSSKFQRILENENRDAIINRVHAPTQDNDCAIYQYVPLNIVGCRVVMKAVLTLLRLFSLNFKVLPDPKKSTIAVTNMSRICLISWSAEWWWGWDGRFSSFFVADILKLALEEPCSTNFSQLTSHVQRWQYYLSQRPTKELKCVCIGMLIAALFV